MRNSLRWLTCGAVAVLASCADSDVSATNTSTQPAISAPAPSRQEATFAIAGNGSLLNLAGKVASTTPNSFQLNTGTDVVTVEMDDWDWFREGRALQPGDEVVVTGRVDQDVWEKKKIEATSVFVRNLGVSFYANGADEEDLAAALVSLNPVTSTLGTVTAVEGPELTVGAAQGPVRVDLSGLKVRPVLKVGDIVHAWGSIDVDPTEKVELMAQGVAVLSQDKTKRM